MSDPLEMARCVEINIENMVSMMPVLEKHPLLGIVRLQIKECIEALEAAEHSVQRTATPEPVCTCKVTAESYKNCDAHGNRRR